MRRPSLTVFAGILLVLLAGCSTVETGSGSPTGTAASIDPGGVTSSAAPSSTTATTTTTAVAPATAPPAPKDAASSTAASGQTLPLTFSTGSATQVITVVAASTSSTTATLQAWDKATSGPGWVKRGAAISAYVGSSGLSDHTNEGLSKTPIGSFALNRGFGTLANPGTSLAYTKTTLADWWISEVGSPLYNTMQTCSSSCSFTLGNPNEHLAAITPEYRYALVIEYNTETVVQGAGSAFFLHVANGSPTAGCVAIPESSLVTIMQWLNPAASPRILIGIG